VKNLIDSASWRAVLFNADGATRTFYEKLAERRFEGTRCTRCEHVPFPPRPFCPACGCDEVEWAPLPTTGTLHAFTTQGRSMRFFKPDVLGLVELPGVGLVLSRIDAPYDQLEIGQPVSVDFFEVNDQLVVHQFRPVAEKDTSSEAP